MGVHACLDGFEAQQRLGEDLLRLRAAQNMVDVANFNLAGRCTLCSVTLFDLAASCLGRAHVVLIRCHFIA